MKLACILSATCLLLGAAPAPSPVDSWKAWHRDLKAQCPSRHVDWIGGQGYYEFLEAFYATLTPAERRDMDKLADYPRLCRREFGGFSCEMGMNLAAAQRLGLFSRLISFGCKRVTCVEPGLCSFDGPARKANGS